MYNYPSARLNRNHLISLMKSMVAKLSRDLINLSEAPPAATSLAKTKKSLVPHGEKGAQMTRV